MLRISNEREQNLMTRAAVGPGLVEDMLHAWERGHVVLQSLSSYSV